MKKFLVPLLLVATLSFLTTSAMAAELNNSFSLWLQNHGETHGVYEYSGLGKLLLGTEVVSGENDFFELNPYVYGELKKGVFLGVKYKTDSEGGDWAGGSFRVESKRPFNGNFRTRNLDFQHPTLKLIIDYYVATDEFEGDRKYRKEALLNFSVVTLDSLDNPGAPPIRIATEVEYQKDVIRLVELRPVVFEVMIKNGQIRPFVGWEREWITQEGKTTEGNSAIAGISLNY